MAPSTSALSNVANVSVGGAHACAVDGSGTLYCWGSNATGQLGVSGIPYSDIPVRVTGMGSGIASVSAGSGHTCALTMSATVKCWGSNTNGQLGNGSTIDSATAVAAGINHSCTLVGGVVWCWGYNRYGSLGDGTHTQRNTPVLVSGLPISATALMKPGAYASQTCAILTGGAPYYWGANYSAQIGDGTAADRLVATPVANLSAGVTEIVGGGDHTCAPTSAGAVKCWGSRRFGQVGDGTWGFSTVPVYVGNPLPENSIRTYLPLQTANSPREGPLRWRPPRWRDWRCGAPSRAFDGLRAPQYHSPACSTPPSRWPCSTEG